MLGKPIENLGLLVGAVVPQILLVELGGGQGIFEGAFDLRTMAVKSIALILIALSSAVLVARYVHGRGGFSARATSSPRRSLRA